MRQAICLVSLTWEAQIKAARFSNFRLSQPQWQPTRVAGAPEGSRTPLARLKSLRRYSNSDALAAESVRPRPAEFQGFSRGGVKLESATTYPPLASSAAIRSCSTC